MLLVIHYAFGALAGLTVLAALLCGAIATQLLDPERSIGDKLTTWLTPNRRKQDFVGSGWRYQKLQWLALAVTFVFLFLFGISDTR